MYKLVIIEDERDVRQRIHRLILQASRDFEIVGEYENGIDAYDGITATNPDLILTDIKIPYSNGLELAERVRRVHPLVKIIVITGYNEFDYAKQAANLGVLGFVSKPITLEDIQIQLDKAKAVLDSEYLTSSSISELEAFYAESLPIIRENDLVQLSNLTNVPAAFEKRLSYNRIDLNYPYFAMAVLDFDEATEDAPERYELAMASVRGLVADSFHDVCAVDLFRRYDKFCLILKSQVRLDPDVMEARLEHLIARASRHSAMPMSAGLSLPFHEERNFVAMRKQAYYALQYRNIMGGSKVFYFGNTADSQPASSEIEESEIKELGYLLRYKSADACIDALLAIRQKVDGNIAPNTYYFTLSSILNTLVRAADDLDGLYKDYIGQADLYNRLLAAKTADEAFAFLTRLAIRIRELNETKIVDSVERNLQNILHYINTHYTDPNLNLESLAAGVNFSISYISALFKKNLNTTFVKHLTNLRMERAQELLINPDLKIVDVASQLGYNDPYYFSFCFKRQTGVSPKEYRAHA